MSFYLVLLKKTVMSMCLQPEDVRGTNEVKVKVKLRCAYASTEGRRRYNIKSFTEFALEIIAPCAIDPRTGQIVAGSYRDYTTPATNTVNNFTLSCN